MESPTGGVKPFSIQGRLYRERERLTNMTEKERNWRRQWIKDQHLAPGEPRAVPQLYQELYNPIRRAYRFPLNVLFRALEPALGPTATAFGRMVTGKVILSILGIYGAVYYFKYNAHDWTRIGGWRVITSRHATIPGDSVSSSPERLKGSDYASHGFKDSPI